MNDFLLQLDPMFTMAIIVALGGLVHRITMWTQDSHGKTRPFVAYLSLALGLIASVLFLVFGRETVLMFVGNIAQFSIGTFAAASTIWVFTHQVVSIFNVKTTTTTTVDPGIAVKPADDTTPSK
jgi:hypothetical protein